MREIRGRKDSFRGYKEYQLDTDRIILQNPKPRIPTQPIETKKTTTMAAPPPPVPLPPMMHLQGAGGPPAPLPLQSQSQQQSSITTLSKLNPTTVVLTHIPPFLRHPRNLRDLLYSTTAIKNVFYSCSIKRFANDNNKKEDEKENVVAVVKFAHAANALSLIRNWKFVREKLNQNSHDEHKTDGEKKEETDNDHRKACKINAFLLYTDGPISLHPEKSTVDASMIETIWSTTHSQRDTSTDTGKVAQQADENMIASLVETYKAIETRQKELDEDAANTGVDGSSGFHLSATYASTTTSAMDDNATNTNPTSGEDGNNNSAPNNNNEETEIKLDSAKVRAAAGGGAYDEEADPLNAPEVLDAVKQFKKKLEVTQGGHRRKRKEYLEKRFRKEVQVAKERLREMRRKEKERLAMMASAPPPPLPPHLPVPPLPPGVSLPPPPPLPPGSGADTTTSANSSARDTGRRGVSNLPAWMTANKNDDDTNNDKNAKKRSAEDLTPSEEDQNNEQPPNKKKFIPSEANRDINTRKERIDVTADGSTSIAAIRAANEAADKAAAVAKQKEEFKKIYQEYLEKASSFTQEQILSGSFPKMNHHLTRPEIIPNLRVYVKEQLMEYLGEEEATLIDFVMNHLVEKKKDGDNDDDGTGAVVVTGKTVDALLEELKMVLEEDADAFVVDLFKKVVEMLKQ